ncbi:hypothetical protein HanRHA438_Chr06g0253321 [Helianthus annuus]|uniref:Uncharacterized protein n=2 Tax=Helianthus annuus TaxID=4232 RepID=A0A9K3IQA9_HELAN|nr:hypothetical protein HanXRQr2_Chr06g0244261 [Helianthus annuus]KAJ0559438.1 hypothetical protein HanHA300_Chr06g0200351 [Helianthus annuus]KAJ0565416.1 hypothetical protein HanIR_Chr06g0262391 [Helianthus annuus]KAJ0910532.1 hypothetical protein HanRHA438_Chr06g0253321 [Helianthus annuus]
MVDDSSLRKPNGDGDGDHRPNATGKEKNHTDDVTGRLSTSLKHLPNALMLYSTSEMKMLLQGCCVCAKPSLKTTRSLENEKLVVVPNSSDKFKVFERLCRFFTNRLQGIPPPLTNY